MTRFVFGAKPKLSVPRLATPAQRTGVPDGRAQILIRFNIKNCR